MDLLKKYLQNSSPSPMIDEADLLFRAKFLETDLVFEDIDQNRLVELTVAHGIDMATAILFDRIRRSERHSRFISDFEAVPVDLQNLPKMSGRLVLVPAGFYRHFPNFGGGGEVILEVARKHGLSPELAPTNSTGLMRDNAELLRELFRKADDKSIILFTLSRGAAEVRLALTEEPALVKKIKRWVMICSTLYGSRQADHMLGLNPWKKWFLYRALRPYGFTPEIVSEFRTGPEGILPQPWKMVFPEGLLTCLVPCCLRSHLNSSGQRRRFDQMSKFGPNDGVLTFFDGLHPSANVFPVWGADHYMRVPGTPFLFYKLFGYFAGLERKESADINLSRLESSGAGGGSVVNVGPFHMR
jgi:hypothetical protein